MATTVLLHVTFVATPHCPDGLYLSVETSPEDPSKLLVPVHYSIFYSLGSIFGFVKQWQDYVVQCVGMTLSIL